MSEPDDTPLTDVGPPPPMPTMAQSPFPDLPRPGRRGDQSAVPFDPLSSQTFSSLTAVNPKPQTEAVTRGQVLAARRAQSYIPKYPTLESMYANHPEIMTHGKLRVERLEPHYTDSEWGEKLKVRGIIAFNEACMQSDEFFQKFGGYRWRVTGMVPVANTSNPGGPPQHTDMATAEFECPLPPNLASLPIAETGAQEMQPNPFGFMGFAPQANMYGRKSATMPNMGMGMGMPYGFPQPAQSQDGAAAPLFKFAETMVDRMSRQPQSQQPLPNAVFDMMSKMGQSGVDNVRQLSQQQFEAMQAQNRMMAEQVARKEQALAEMQAKITERPPESMQMIESVARLMQVNKGSADTDYVRQLQADHERTTANMREQHSRELSNIKEDHARLLSQLKDEAERSIQRERQSAREHAEIDMTRQKMTEQQLVDRERMLRDEHARVLDSMRTEHTRVLEYLKTDYDSRLREVKDSLDRETRMHQSVFTSQNASAEQAHAAEMRSIQTQLAAALSEKSSLESKLAEFEKERNKPLLERVQDIKATTEALQEITGGSSSDDDKEDAKTSWYESPLAVNVLTEIAKQGATLLPKIVDKIPAMGGKAKAEDTAGLPPPPAQMQQPQRMLRRRPQAVLPPPPQRRMTFSDNNFQELPSPERDPRDQSTSSAGPRPFRMQGDSDPNLVHPQPDPLPPPAPAPPPPPPPAPRPRPAAAAAPPPEPQAAQATTTEIEEDWSAFAWTNLPAPQLQMVLQVILDSLESKQKPEDLVVAMASQTDIKMLKIVMEQLDIDRLHASIKACPHTSQTALAKGVGKRYLAKIWQGVANFEPSSNADDTGPSESETST